MRPALALVLLLAVAGCSPKGALFLNLEAQRAGVAMRIPDDVDHLALQVTDEGGSKVVFEKEWDLSLEQFPLSLGLEPGGETPGRVRVVATLSKTGVPVGGAEAFASFAPGEVTTLTLRVVAE